jgi:hypothetical protein
MRTLLSILLCCGPLLADLTPVRAEPNLEKRSKAALEHAEKALKESRRAYSAGDPQLAAAHLEEVEHSVELAETSLKESGKNPHKSPKYFKIAEMKTGGLLRQIEAFSRDMNDAADGGPAAGLSYRR